MALKHFRPYKLSDIEPFLQQRKGEQRIGETLILPSDFANVLEAVTKFSGEFVILGIPEDIGPMANFGKPGARHTFKDFLKSFLMVQDNRFLAGNSILLLGEVEMDDLYKKAVDKNPLSLRNLVEEIDERVFPIIELIISQGKIPIIIGGGHNNALPAIKGASLGIKKAIAAVNFDAHADLRPLEGRHSGNGFSYAIAQGYLDGYYGVGLHQSYNNDYTWSVLDSDKSLFAYLSYEEMLDQDLSSSDIVSLIQKFIKKQAWGLEIDMDCIENAASSAQTPVGLRPDKLRKIIRKIISRNPPLYLNVSEGISVENSLTGKLISYLVCDFIRCCKK